MSDIEALKTRAAKSMLNACTCQYKGVAVTHHDLNCRYRVIGDLVHELTMAIPRQNWLELMEQLIEPEAGVVEISHANADFGGPNYYIGVYLYSNEMFEHTFTGDTRLECFQKAVKELITDRK